MTILEGVLCAVAGAALLGLIIMGFALWSAKRLAAELGLAVCLLRQEVARLGRADALTDESTRVEGLTDDERSAELHAALGQLGQ